MCLQETRERNWREVGGEHGCEGKTATFCGRALAVGHEVPKEGLVSPSSRRIGIMVRPD